MSANADLITASGDIYTTRGNSMKTNFSYMGQNVKNYFGLFGYPAILSPISMYMSNKEAI